LGCRRDAATPGKACQCIMIAANEGTDDVLAVNATMCGISSPKAAPARHKPASWFLSVPAVHSSWW
jgi:hypothetical protein